MDLNRLDGFRQRYEESRREAFQASTERVRDAREALQRLSEVRARRLEAVRETQREARQEAARQASTRRSDEVEISERGRILADRHEESSEDSRAERVAKLRELHQAGQLETPERIERTASRLMGGE